MVVKVLAQDEAHVEVLDRGLGVQEREVERLKSWVSSHLTSARTRDRVGEFVLARRARQAEGGDCFTFVADYDAV
jgi:hypothetical protein